jgi:hypothetical protein
MRKMRVEDILEAQGKATALYVALAVVVGIFFFMVVACALSIN